MDKKKIAATTALGVIIGAATYLAVKYKNTGDKKKFDSQDEISQSHKPGIYEKYVKRPMDFCCALIASIILSPVMLVTAILVRIKLGSPVIFMQERLGLKENSFKMYKFRSMTDQRDERGNLLPDEQRLTPFGSHIRSLSIDELPQIFNILKGDMAVVGPRPLVTRYLPYYTEEERHRHDVRPGLTCLAQINGRNRLSWDEMFRFDLDYVNDISFAHDVSILKETIYQVLRRQDVADYRQIKRDIDGKAYIDYTGEVIRMHSPLDIERTRVENEKRNR